MQKQSKLQKLTMKDNFMFGAVMIDPENCKPLLEMALGIQVGRLTVSIEKSLVYHPEYKGVRLDVEASDEKRTRYNVEMQVVQKPHLERRSRYYHSQIDMELLMTGEGYGNLPDAYVIFICDFDPFGLGRYQYTFKNVCLEEKGFVLRDGRTTVFLNTCGKNRDEVSEKLVCFLEYIGSDLPGSTRDFQDGYVARLQAAVSQIKSSREMEARYMLLEEMLQDEREAGRAQGLAEGKAEGKAEGRAESVLDLLQELSGEVPEKLRERILAERDSEVLKHYLKMASLAGTVEEFIGKISQ